MSSQEQLPSFTATSEPQSVSPQNPASPKHPYRVYGYKVSQEWLCQFGKDLGIVEQKNTMFESAVFNHLTVHLPGLQYHFIDDPSDPVLGYSHCLGIANNWNRKRLGLVKSRLPTWQAILKTEEKPQWYATRGIPRMFVH